ncbi:MAG: PH domain-containing protein [Candidatus Ozemobacteraceae bacterium]
MTDQEEVFFEGKLPFTAVLFSFHPILVLLFGWNILLIWSYIQTFGLKIKVTSQRIILVKGFISQDSEEVEYYRVKDIEADQGLLHRLLGLGTITIFSDDSTSPNLTFVTPDPMNLREKIRNCVRSERAKRHTIAVD